MDYDFKTVSKKPRGGFGIVEIVKDEISGKSFARKTFSLINHHNTAFEEIARKRFIKEVQYQFGIHHRNIVPVYDYDLESVPPWYIMPIAESTLEEDFDNGILDRSNFIKAIFDVLDGLEYLHGIGITHRDITTRNILRFHDIESGDSFYALSDFGLIALEESRLTILTTVGMKKGADYYTAPELLQSLSNATAQSDIFSVGCLIHDFAGMENRIPCTEIHDSSELGMIMLACTKERPSNRFRSVIHLKEALFPFILGGSATLEASNEKILELLNSKADEYSIEEMEFICDYCLANKRSEKFNLIFKNISLNCIEKLVKHPDFALRLSRIYFEFAMETIFDYNETDVIALRLSKFFACGNPEVNSQGLIALLKLGVNHNRWFVLWQFVKKMRIITDTKIVERIKIEFIVEKHQLKPLLLRMERSIGVKAVDIDSNFTELFKNILSDAIHS